MEQKDGKGYTTDQYELTRQLVDQAIGEKDDHFQERHDEVMEAVGRVENLVNGISSARAHTVVQYIWLGILSIFTFWKYR